MLVLNLIAESLSFVCGPLSYRVCSELTYFNIFNFALAECQVPLNQFPDTLSAGASSFNQVLFIMQQKESQIFCRSLFFLALIMLIKPAFLMDCVELPS